MYQMFLSSTTCLFLVFLSTCCCSSPNDKYTMKKIRTVQARIQGDEPKWDAKANKFISKYGAGVELNTVNTASVEGALMYVQAECINSRDQSVKCERKWNVKYAVMLDVQIVQPTASVAYHLDESVTPEYGHYVAMDGNRCTPLDAAKKDVLPDACNRYYGQDNKVALGPYVGGGKVSTDKRAPYPENYWFSYPNSCPTMHRDEKTKQCKAENPGGMCTGVEKLDGKECVYKYEILGYIALDDLVGITSMVNKETGANFTDVEEFCKAGLTEFYADEDMSNFKSDLTFWDNPTDEKANAERSEKMITAYHKLVDSTKGKNMKKLPSIAELNKANEQAPCYHNVKACAENSFGCKRMLYAQICTPCTKDGEAGCVKAPEDFKFPALVKPVDPTKAPTDPTKAPTGSGSGSGSTPTPTKISASLILTPISSAFLMLISALMIIFL